MRTGITIFLTGAGWENRLSSLGIGLVLGMLTGGLTMLGAALNLQAGFVIGLVLGTLTGSLLMLSAAAGLVAVAIRRRGKH